MTTPPPYEPQPWYAPPPPPPPRKRTGWTVAIVLIALLVLGGAAVGIYLLTRDGGSVAAAGKAGTTSTAPGSTGSPKRPEPGACVEDKSRSADDAEIRYVPCDAPEAVYRVAKTLPKSNDDCPSEDYDVYYEEGIGDGFAICLMLNAREGDCFTNMTDENANTTRVDCAQGEFKVITVAEGEARESICPGEDTVVAMVYPEPPNTVCLEAL